MQSPNKWSKSGSGFREVCNAGQGCGEVYLSERPPVPHDVKRPSERSTFVGQRRLLLTGVERALPC